MTWGCYTERKKTCVHTTFCMKHFNRRECLWCPANIKGANDQAKLKIYVGRLTHRLWTILDPRPFDFWGRQPGLWTIFRFAHTSTNNVTETVVLDCSPVGSKHVLCFVHSRGQKIEQKCQQKIWLGFIDILLYLQWWNIERVKEIFEHQFLEISPPRLKTHTLRGRTCKLFWAEIFLPDEVDYRKCSVCRFG